MIAPFGHWSAQRPQAMHFVDLWVTVFTTGMCHGQDATQVPQPTHFSGSTSRVPSLSVLMAPCGQLVWHSAVVHMWHARTCHSQE